MSKRQEWTVLGRVIGTATGWDQADTFEMQIYDFEPAEGVVLPKSGCLNINFETGLAQSYDDDGKVAFSVDIIKALGSLK